MDKSRLKNIKALVTDVDGVLTDAMIWWDSDKQWKRKFSVRDGVGLKLLMESGYKVGVITGGRSEDVQTRMKFLGVHYFYDGVSGDKLEQFQDLLKASGLHASEILYIGDEVYDVSVMRIAGVGASVPDAVEEAKQAAQYITKSPGGLGAVREICDLIRKHGFFSAS
jgi:3-deoxy-D-manno-octulosonate 8-phosphate phosphatase (KDO 8-P phosphatase)